MLKIRMKRAGGKNHPFFRVVVIDSRKARDSRAVEEVGYYNPLEEPLVINVNRERVDHWVKQGAQLSDSVRTLLRRANTTHPTRRAPEAFEAMTPEERPARTKKAKPVKAESAVAVASTTSSRSCARRLTAPSSPW